MKNKNFIVILTMMFILFAAVFGSVGCTGRNHSRFINNKDDFDQKTEPTPDSIFTVTFDSNGGSEVPIQEVEAGGTVTMPDNPTKDGYVFAGWFKDNVTFENMFVFGIEGNKVTQDITLYAQWFEHDTLITDYAINEVAIGYFKGDNANHVTRNLTLPVKIYSADISWISSSGAVSSNGTVTRQDTDTDVTLTATANYNGKSSEPKTFNVKVIRKRTRNNSEIRALPINEAKSGDITITRNASGDVRDIEGMYVKFDIKNADDALDAVTVLRNELGIRSPSEELESFLVTSDKYSSEYAFSQVHKGVRVWGRNLVVSTNSSGQGDFLHSSFLPSNIVAKADGKNDIGSSAAESKARDMYLEEVEIDSYSTEKVVYSLEDYEDDPVYAYIVRVYTISGDKYIDESVVMNADTGKIITTIPNISYAFDMREAKGINELGKPISFEVLYGTAGIPPHVSYIMSDPERYIQISWLTRALLIPVDNQFNTWHDKQQVSVYFNMREIMSWWKKEFGRDSLDGNGTTLDVVTHAIGDTDNAAWNYSFHRIFVYDKAENSKFDHSCGAAVDFLTHETTHGVMQYITGGEHLKKNAAGAINEGYADIFACIKDKNWKFAEDLFDSDNKNNLDCDRNIASPNSQQARTKARDLYTTLDNIYNAYKDDDPDDGYVHSRSFKVSHAAYLMHVSNDVNGLTWQELGNVWYKSMHKGLDATSKFEDVQRCVMAAARELELSSQKRFVIESAFSQLGYGSKATLTGTVTDYDTKLPIVAVRIKTKIGTVNNNVEIWPNDDGYFSASLPVGETSITFMSIPENEYVTFSTNLKLEAVAPREGNVLNVQLVKVGPGSLNGTVYKDTASSPSPIEGVTVKIRTDFDVKEGNALKTTTTDSNGCYSFDLGESGAGYYTIEMTKEGYKTSTFNVTVSGQTTQDGYLLGNGSDPDNDNPSNGENNNNDDEYSDINDILIDEKHFPDQYFRAYILSSFDINRDSILSKHEIEQVKIIDVAYMNAPESGRRGTPQFRLDISSLKGIEYFYNLEVLSCPSCKLTELNVGNNTALVGLNCANNKITKLDISKNNLLEYLFCNDNRLSSLNTSNKTALSLLSCENNQIIHLNVSNNSILRILDCGHNKLIDLDVSTNINLDTLFCNDNQLNKLDVSKNIELRNLDCSHNKISILDISHCPKIKPDYLICDNIKIIWPTTSTLASTQNTSLHSTQVDNSDNHSFTIVAKLPEFTVDHTGIYFFSISFDTKVPSDSVLIMRLSSDDENSENESCIFFDEEGSQIIMPLTESLDRVRVSANFEQGVSYSPVIIAQSDGNSSNSGGCNAGMFGIVIVLVNLVLLKKH